MRKIFTAINRLIAGLMAILFIVTLLAAVVLVVFENRMLEADVYLQALGRDDLYQELPAILATAIVSGPRNEVAAETGESPPAYLKFLTVQDWENLLGLILPAEDMRPVTEQAITEVFAVLNGQADLATFDLRPIKEQLRQNGVQAYLQVIRAQPACTPEEFQQVWGQASLDTESELLCRPSEEQLALFMPALEQGIQEEASKISDEVILLDAREAPLAASFQELRRAIRLSLIIPLILLGLVTIFAVRTLKSWLRWWGIPLVISSAFMVLSGFAGSPALQIILAARNQPGDGLRAGQIALAVVQSISEQLFMPVSWVGLVLGLLGFCLWLASLLLPQTLLESE